MTGSWLVQLTGSACAVRKTREAIRIACNRRPPSSPKYVILFTTFLQDGFPPASVPEWYRTRWQVESVFRRFKSLAQLGHLPERDGDSAKAWLYGKLFVALLVGKLIRHARSISPWGCHLEALPPAQHLV